MRSAVTVLVSMAIPLMTALLATAPAPQQLLVRNADASGQCRQAPPGWRAGEPIQEATPTAVAGDLRRALASKKKRARGKL